MAEHRGDAWESARPVTHSPMRERKPRYGTFPDLPVVAEPKRVEAAAGRLADSTRRLLGEKFKGEFRGVRPPSQPPGPAPKPGPAEETPEPEMPEPPPDGGVD